MMDANTISKLHTEGLESLGLFYGVYRGTVTDNNDDKNMGRLKVRCEILYGDEVYDYWAFPRGMVAGMGNGIFWVPSPGDMVWVTCERGDPRWPLWEHAYALEGKTPAGGKPKVKVFLTPGGQRIELNDDNNSIDLVNKDGFRVKLKSDGIYIGKDKNLAKFLDDLFGLFAATRVATDGGPMPFLNAADYASLRNQIAEFLKPSV